MGNYEEEKQALEEAKEKIQEVKQTAESTKKIAADIATGNVVGAAKEVLKNKKLRRRAILNAISSILPFILGASILVVVVGSMAQIMMELLSKIGTTVTRFHN